MPKENFSYNPNYLHKDSLSYFRKFILWQDGVDSEIPGIKKDSIFQTNKFQRVKTEAQKPLTKSILSSHLLKPKTHEPKEKPIINQVWIPWLIIFCFLLFAIAKYGYYKRVRQILKAFFANRLFVQLSREGGLMREQGSIFLFSSYLLALSFFVYKTYDYYYAAPFTLLASIILFIKVLSGVILIYLGKMVLFRISGYIFKATKETSYYVLNIFIFGQVLGIILLPVVVLLSYVNNEIFIYCGIIAISSLYLFRLFRGISIIKSSIKISAYYLFVYLCTLEILPLFILAKIINLI